MARRFRRAKLAPPVQPSTRTSTGREPRHFVKRLITVTDHAKTRPQWQPADNASASFHKDPDGCHLHPARRGRDARHARHNNGLAATRSPFARACRRDVETVDSRETDGAAISLPNFDDPLIGEPSYEPRSHANRASTTAPAVFSGRPTAAVDGSDELRRRMGRPRMRGVGRVLTLG